MKKKLFLKLFIFAVIGAFVTFTSCKDYDDDISRLDTDLAAAESSLQAAVTELNTLKTQIAAAATDSEVAAAVAAAKTQAIDAAKADATALLNTLKGGYTGTLKELNDKIVAQAALITVLQGDVSTLKTDLDAAELQIAANKAAIELQQSILDKYLLVAGDDNVVDAIAAIKAELAAAGVDIDALSTKIDAIDEALNVLDFAKINSMITEISFDFAYDDWNRDQFLDYSTTTEVVDFVFATGINNPITFVKGQRLASQAQKVIVKVSPANADLSKMLDKISLVRGDSNTEINNYLKAVKAERAYPLLVRSMDARATPTATGLWYVSFELSQTADLEDLAELTQGEGVDLYYGVEEEEEGHYLFAMAIENTVEKGDDAEDRFVISDFVISIDTSEEFERASALNFMVDNTNVADINNRYDNTSESLREAGITYEELVWSGTAQPTVIKSGTGVNTTHGDNRSLKPIYPAVQGVPMKIKITDDVESIRAMYVTLDYQANAIESAPSEWNAWQSYNYAGLGTVVEGTETTIMISGNTAINDMIGFRVFAVNLDGTLVDPDGKAFYVSVGTPAGTWPTAATSVTPTSITMINSAETAVTLSKLNASSSYTYTWTADKAEAYGSPVSTPLAAAFNVQFLPATGAALFTTTTGATNVTFTAPDFSAVKKIVAVPTEGSWLAYKDGKVYNGKLTIKNATGHILTTMNVTFKKELPTGVPAGFSVKSGQMENNVWNAYLEPATWAAISPYTNNGTMPLSDLYNFPTGTASNFETIFEASQPKTGGGHNPVTVIGGGELSVDKAYVDNTTQHATSVVYNYGLISTESKSNNVVVPYKVNVLNFQTVYSNIYNDTYSWNWATRAELGLGASAPLPYKTEVVYGDETPFVVLAAHIYGKSTRDTKYNAFLNASYNGSLDASVGVVTAKFITNANQQEEYFTVAHTAGTFTFTPKSGATNPLVDLPSTLVITTKDMYGKNVVINVPITLKKR